MSRLPDQISPKRCHHKGTKAGKPKEVYIYQVADNQDCMTKWNCQAVVAQTAFTPMIAMDLLEHGIWKGAGVMGPEAFDSLPFMEKMPEYGFPYGVKEMKDETDR